MSDAATLDRFATPIPPAVRRAAEHAERLRQQVTGETTTVVTAEPPPAAPEPPATTVVEPAPQQQQQQQMELPLEPQAPAPAHPPDESTWEQRYRTLEGKYRTETAQLRSDLRALQDEAANLRMLMATLQTTPAPAAAPVQTDFGDDAEQYGAELITKAQNWAMAAMKPQLDALHAQIESLKASSQTTTTEVVKSRVDALLDKEIPNWRTIDHSEAFHAWLDQVDPLSGAKRLPMLQAAYTHGEAARCLAIFRAYLAEHTAVTQPQGHTTAIPVETPPAAQVPLEELAAPGRSRPGAPAPQNEARIFTQSQIAAFYRDVQKGTYRGREAEQQRLEADIIRAGREGRVR